MSDDEVENLINNIAGDIEPPGVAQIHELAAARKQKRQTAMRVGGVAALAFAVLGVVVWMNQPEGTRFATSGEDTVAETNDGDSGDIDSGTEGAVADDSAPLEFEEWDGVSSFVGLTVEDATTFAEANGLVSRVVRIDDEDLFVTLDLVPGRLNFTVRDGIVVAVDVEGGEDIGPETVSVTQRRLVATPRWFVEVAEGTTENVHFSGTQITFSGCNGGTFSVSFDIAWTQDSFAVLRRVPADPNQITPAFACETYIGGFASLAIPSGFDVVIEALNDGRVRLTSGDWAIALSATRPGDSGIRMSYVSLPVEEAGELAEANGLEWRVIREDGEELRRRDDLRPERLNFSTQNGIVIDVVTDAQMADQNSPQPPTTTTTTEPPVTTTTAPPVTPESYISLTVDEAGALADANGRQWRVARIDGEDRVLTLDLQPNRLNFTVEDGIVVGVSLG